ncbi:hypothetical protein FHG64_06235 [Antarcticibacterium flavum]|uniref:DUF7793 domain-containing protein n=1 Tax=Antarcticibacterium flavum TaxID=2058175 RepID=A0A5B7X1R3_9FLAO|nr:MULTISPECIES: hypothetical protein [Antarcticibacterium]MCM4161596.1 hypothetical protein [Antarcticibacterium sp. W02-3]QCY69035.1 hypothetical protein FHG64_06235 [Antarcticibacterium flavum]
MEKKYFENERVRIKIETGILYFEYLPNTVLTLEVARKIVAARLALQENKSYPIFCDIRGIDAIDKQARDYLAKEGSILAKAVSSLALEPVSTSIVEFYIQTSKPRIPTKIFTNKFLALKFLEQYKD